MEKTERSSAKPEERVQDNAEGWVKKKEEYEEHNRGLPEKEENMTNHSKEGSNRAEQIQVVGGKA